MKQHRSRVEKDIIAIEGGMLMTEYNWTLWQVSGRIGCPMSSLYKIMMERLPRINPNLYSETRERLEEHKKWGGRHAGKDVLDAPIIE